VIDNKFVLGVNYWPRRRAMRWWSDFDADEVANDFTLIRSLGLDVVRIFLLWDDWQPTPDSVDEDCLAALGVTLDLAVAHGLKLDITFFTGHMSGPNWAPGWLLRDGPRDPGPLPRTLVSGGVRTKMSYHNMFHYPPAIAAAELLLRSVVGRYGEHPGVWLWNLGNEPDLFAWPHSPAAGRAWVKRMCAVIRDLDPVHPVTCGLHGDSLKQENGLRVSDVFAETDIAVMHSYPMYTPWAVRPLDPDYVPFTCALTQALCGKPVLAEEWGGCTAPPGEPSQIMRWSFAGEAREQFMASEEDFARYVAQVLPRLVEVGATGALLWCFADYVPALWNVPPCDEAQHERFFGLVRPDGSLKPHAEVLRQFAASEPHIMPATRRVALDVAANEYYRDPEGNMQRLYRHYLREHA
jgi:endo-1,4-beta-mannosidase